MHARLYILDTPQKHSSKRHKPSVYDLTWGPHLSSSQDQEMTQTLLRLPHHPYHGLENVYKLKSILLLWAHSYIASYIQLDIHMIINNNQQDSWASDNIMNIQ